jgi:outer membrane protein assembly factor BamA
MKFLFSINGGWQSFLIVVTLLFFQFGIGMAADLKPETILTTCSVPDFMYRKQRMPTIMTQQKREGWYTTVMPAVGVDPETGFNFGALTEIFYNKSKDDPFFEYTPYRRKISAGAVITTQKWQSYALVYDEPYVNDTPWRLRGVAQVWINPVATYFGLGEDSMQDLHSSGSSESFDNYDAYQNSLNQESGGVAYTKYNELSRNHIVIQPTAEYDLLGGILRPLGGFQFSRYWINDYQGTTVDAIDANGDNVDATQATTKLAEDCASGTAIGCDGGFDNFLKLGLTLDTRDFEPDPTRGFLIQSVAEISTKVLGSDFDYQRFNFSAAGYHNLISTPRRLVLGGRILYTMQFNDVPFFSIPTMSYTADRNWEGLGGFHSLRGYVLNRFVGKAAALTNWELRWKIGEKTIFDQNLGFTLAPFWDAGRVFDSPGDSSFEDWKHAVGGGLRLAWNLSTVISFDYGVGSEGSAFYMELGYVF